MLTDRYIYNNDRDNPFSLQLFILNISGIQNKCKTNSNNNNIIKHS